MRAKDLWTLHFCILGEEEEEGEVEYVWLGDLPLAAEHARL